MPVGPESGPSFPRHDASWRAGVVIIVATLLAYANSFPGIFVFDDALSVIENPTIRTLSSITLRPPANAGVGGRPLANLSFALNYAISGAAPWSYHATNVLLHALAAFALFGIVRRTLLLSRPPMRITSLSTSVAFSTALLWSVHPLLTGTVNYVSQRTELLMALCYLVTLYAFIRAATETGNQRWPVVAVVACTCGIACKETMAPAPLLVLLDDRVFLTGRLRDRWRLHASLASTWLVLIALAFAAPARERGVGLGLGISAADYALTSCRALVHYLRLAVWPDTLVFDYGWDFTRLLPTVWPQVVLVTLLGVVSLVGAWRRHPLGFLGSGFLLLLAPTTSFIPILQQPIAESRMYLPLALVIATIVIAARSVAPRIASPAFAGVAIACLGLTLARNHVFRSPLTVWSDTVAKAPRNARAHNYLGIALLESARVPDAIRSLQTAVALRPGYADAHNNLAIAFQRDGRNDEALAEFERTVALNADSADAHYNLGSALFSAHRTEAAVAHYETALRLRPDHARAHNNLSIALLQLGRIGDAIAEAETARRLDPVFAEAHYNLGNALAAAGRVAEAQKSFAQALRLNPSFAKAAHNLGVLRLRAGDVPSAIRYFESALRSDPNYGEAQRNLAIARHAATAVTSP